MLPELDDVSHDDGSPDHGFFGEFWQNYDNYEYYWDEYNELWLRYNTINKTWDYWTYTFLIGWHWTILDHHIPLHDIQRAYQENPCPLDDEIYILVGLVTVYEICKMKKVWEEKVKTKKSTA